MSSANGHIVNAFTIDVEDYYHVQSFSIDSRLWDQYESRVVANTHRLLRILDQHQVRATCFILGWVAERFPQLVRDIQTAGHEIGCHSYAHRLIYDMTPDEFRADLRRATDILTNITGQPIVSFRAPSFSITKKSLWALDILIEEGYRYDSSIFPIYHDKYGIPNAERFPHRIEGSLLEFPPSAGWHALRHEGRDIPPATNSQRTTPQPTTPFVPQGVPPDQGVRAMSGSLLEFPPSVYRLLGLNLPVSGGGYFRLYPLRLTLHLLGRINRRLHQPFIFYVHPWELDPDQPRLPGPLRSRFRHYQNLRTTERKLHGLLQAFPFAPLSESLAGRHDPSDLGWHALRHEGRDIPPAANPQPTTPFVPQGVPPNRAALPRLAHPVE